MRKQHFCLQTAALLAATLCNASQPGQPAVANRTTSGTMAASSANTDPDGLAVSGYDVVSYFDEKRAAKGNPAITATHEGAKYQFVSTEHRDRFLREPDGYLPQYGGYCAYGAAAGHKAKADPESWTVIDGKLYLNYNKQVQKEFLKDPGAKLQKADANWKTLNR